MHKALGRGLESLLPVSGGHGAPPAADAAVRIALDRIRPNRFQPRHAFDDVRLKELADSIKKHGLAQPILVSPSAIPGEYEIIAGERRWRAARMAGLKEIVAVIKQASDKDRFHIALIENIQRENLNPLEEARAYRRLIDEFKHTQEELAGVVGKERSVVANTLRLLSLPPEVQDLISAGKLSSGHGRMLAGLDDAARQCQLAARCAENTLSVRELERIVAEIKAGSGAARKKPARRDAELAELAEDLQRRLGTKVHISGRAARGKIMIHYFSLKELERIAAVLRGRRVK